MMWRGGGGGGGAPATGGVQDFLAIELWTMGGRHRELPFLHLCPQGQIQGGGGGARAIEEAACHMLECTLTSTNYAPSNY